MTDILVYIRTVFCVAGIACFAFMHSGCEKALDIKNPPSHPVAVFDELWNVMDKRYALFSVKGVDWEKTYTEYRSMVNDSMTEKALFNLMVKMLETLRDGHVTLMSDQDTATYDNFYRAYSINFNYNNIMGYYLMNEYKVSGPVIYKIVNNIGYLYYNSFYNDISDAQIDMIINDMKDIKGLIVDVRSNTGGRSKNVDRLFRRFISARRLVKYESKKNGPGHDDFSEPEPFYLDPAGTAFTKPVVVLTNRSCFSGCNDFVSYMAELPNVKLMGDQTGGGGSIPYNYILANGWKIQYSATVTLSINKVSIENGIPPDDNIGITPIDEINGRDPILEKAYQSLQ
jgi:hypothetical protein